MGRLVRDEAGNTLAMTAAAMLPLLGIVGGAIDMSRTYAVKSRLQSACDAGVLAGKKAVGGEWTEANNVEAKTVAEQMFHANIQDDAWGAENITPQFDSVEQKASADVPLTIMQIFGRDKTVVNVTCSAELAMANADIMFVLDNTGSMNDKIPDGDNDASNDVRKIDGLKVAVNCFYEILAKKDNEGVTSANCGYEDGKEPWVGASNGDDGAELRFGFVPYDQMVNVGRLLPAKAIFGTAANEAVEYQTRVPNTTPVQIWTTGNASSVVWDNNWSPATIPATYYTRQNTSGWSDQNSDASTEQGIKAYRQTMATNSTQCNNYNTLAGSGTNLTALSQSGSSINTSGGSTWSPAAPVHPQATQSAASTQSQTITVTQWRYIWEKRSNVTACFLERRQHSNTYNRMQTGAATRPVNWTAQNAITSWTYKKHPINVSSFKIDDFKYKDSIMLPLNETQMNNVRLSGSTSTTNIKVVSDRQVTWEGCIEERQTHRVTDGNPSDDYDVIPDEAYDLQVGKAVDANDSATKWRFALKDVTWARYANGQRTTSPVTTTSNLNQNFGWSCPIEAVKLTEFDGDGSQFGKKTSKDFSNYVARLKPGGNTYHDIGLIWGQRLMSSEGLFGAENQTGSNGAKIVRHMVFMTDGETYNNPTNYTSYGIDWHDRRQTDESVPPTQDILQKNNDARSSALCKAIKDAGDTELWVVYYGVPDNTTATRLKKCASDDAHFILATNTTVLITAFKNIAKKIAELQLT
jgi:Flp pilus assembly protein TadG